MSKIIQVLVHKDHLLGLGDDNKMYEWDWATGEWELYKEWEEESYAPDGTRTRIS